MRLLPTEIILGYRIVSVQKAECTRQIIHLLDSGEKRKSLVCANPHSIEVARKDKVFEQAIKNADLIVPDGVGIVIASKILGGSIRDRITGSDIFLGLSNVLNKKNNYSYFFLGSTEKNLSQIKNKMKVDFPNIKVVGTYSPPFKLEFKDHDNKLMVEAINRAKPDVLWIGMTAPKQEKWIYRNKDHLDVKFIGAIGAVFDFYTGNVKRAHPIFQKIGLEWFSRLLLEPRRLWRRYFVSGPMFVIRVLRQKLG